MYGQLHALILSLLSRVWLFYDTMDCSLPGSSVHETSRARILEWAAISFPRGSSWPRDQTRDSCLLGIFFTPEPPKKPLLLFYWVMLSPNSSIKWPEKQNMLLIFFFLSPSINWGNLFNPSPLSPGGSEVKASTCNAGDLGSIPGSGRFPGEGSGSPLQYSWLENPMDRGSW